VATQEEQKVHGEPGLVGCIRHLSLIIKLDIFAENVLKSGIKLVKLVSLFRFRAG
jgi:hypothetical protein